MDRAKAISTVFEKTGVQLSADDPAFYLVEINRLLLEEEVKKIASDLSATADKFDATAAQNIDNFIHVANEALSKFMLRTNELKAIVEGLTLPKLIESQAGRPNQNEAEKSKDKTEKVMFVVVFACGVLLGALLMGILFLVK